MKMPTAAENGEVLKKIVLEHTPYVSGHFAEKDMSKT
jgi:hypothetical protein